MFHIALATALSLCPPYICDQADRVDPPSYQHPNADVERWHLTAIEAGWSEADWPVIACIMEDPWTGKTAESRGDPTVTNLRGRDRSFGLMQLNTKGSMMKWFRQHGINDPYELLEPATNLRIAKELSAHASGWAKNRWQPWRSTRARAKCFGLVGAVS